MPTATCYLFVNCKYGFCSFFEKNEQISTSDTDKFQLLHSIKSVRLTEESATLKRYVMLMFNPDE